MSPRMTTATSRSMSPTRATRHRSRYSSRPFHAPGHQCNEPNQLVEEPDGNLGFLSPRAISRDGRPDFSSRSTASAADRPSSFRLACCRPARRSSPSVPGSGSARTSCARPHGSAHRVHKRRAFDALAPISYCVRSGQSSPGPLPNMRSVRTGQSRRCPLPHRRPVDFTHRPGTARVP